MSKLLKKFYGTVLTGQQVESQGSEGQGIVRYDNLVVFVPFAAPGDVVDIRINGGKKRFLSGEIVGFSEKSAQRATPPCAHFGHCGGCKSQHLEYTHQLAWKAKVVEDAFVRLHKLDIPEPGPIHPSPEIWNYRNKLEFSFSANRWILADEEADADRRALGFHIPGRFDKVLDIHACYLQDPLQNEIRNTLRDLALQSGLSFYHPHEQNGYFRNCILRNNRNGEWMLILIIGDPDTETARNILFQLRDKFPAIKSCFLVVNTKMNDTIYDLDTELIYGEPWLREKIENLNFGIRPKSFFQPNPNQAENLYRFAIQGADIQSTDVVYDLYCGTGTLSLLAASRAHQVLGIESVAQAIEDARENARFNGLENVHFEVGDMRKVITSEYIKKYPAPDVIITDPPRSGMDKEVVDSILALRPKTVAYISCNPATQARDIQWMQEFYEIVSLQPVDMFPHTHHIENVVILRLR